MYNTYGNNKVIVISTSENRIGYDIDNENLKIIFEYLNYDYDIWLDREKQFFESELENLLLNFSKNYKSIIFFVLTHGEDDRFFLKNDEQGTTFKNFISTLKRTDLSEIPKIFFFQPCRKSSQPRSKETGYTNKLALDMVFDIKGSHPNSHIFEFYSTCSGKKFLRNTFILNNTT